MLLSWDRKVDCRCIVVVVDRVTEYQGEVGRRDCVTGRSTRRGGEQDG